MKKISTLLTCAILLSSCSVIGNQSATAIVAPTFTNTPADAPTFTPTVPTPTFTVTPTLMGLRTDSTSVQLILTPLEITPLPTGTPILLVTRVPMLGFASVSVSAPEFYKGKKCEPTSVKFTAQVSNPASTFVALFVRFKSKEIDAKSEWTSINMQTIGAGLFTHDLVPSEMKYVDYFENAWVQYQFVATDSKSNELGRTEVFSEQLALLNCVPTPVPTESITPTVFVP